MTVYTAVFCWWCIHCINLRHTLFYFLFFWYNICVELLWQRAWLRFKLHRSHFYLSASSPQSLPLCGRATFYVLLRHIAGVLGQTPDEWLRKQFPRICLLSRSSPLSHALSVSLWGWITFLLLPSDVSLSYIGAWAHAHTHTHAHASAHSSDTHTQSDKSPLLPKSR